MTGPAGAALTVRDATPDDGALIFEWANDPVTRAQSFSTAPIEWDGHRAWLAGAIADPHRHLYVASLDGVPVGQVRFDAPGGGPAEVSVTVAPAWRGRGLASRILRVAGARAMEHAGIQAVRAFVKPGNDASRRAFLRAGYTARGAVLHHGHDAELFEAVLTRR